MSEARGDGKKGRWGPRGEEGWLSKRETKRVFHQEEAGGFMRGREGGLVAVPGQGSSAVQRKNEFAGEEGIRKSFLVENLGHWRGVNSRK